MFVKKFEADSLEEGLRRVKRELGPTALILSTQKKKSGLMGKSTVEITAAYETKPSASKPVAQSADLSKVFPHRKMKEYGDGVGATSRPATQYVDIVDDPNAVPSPVTGNQRLKKFEDGFLRLGLAPDSAKELGSQLAFDYPESETRQALILDRLRAKQLGSAIQTWGEEELVNAGSLAAVGLAGVGKTSFLVKLALLLKACEKSPSLLSMDSRKVVGQSELAAYARLIKVPFHRSAPDSGVKNYNLVDIQALQLHNEEANEQLCEKLSKMSSATFLVVDGSQRLNEIMRQFHAAHKTTNLQAIAFTKMDNVAQRGIIYDVLKRTKLPLLGISASDSFKQILRFLTPPEVASYILRRGEL